MEHNPPSPVTSTTNELLAKLNDVMNQSSLVRKIVEKSEKLWSLDQSKCDSKEAQQLRNEITRLEDLLRTTRL